MAPNFPVVKWRQLSPVCSRRVTSEYKKTLDEVLTQIDELRGCGGQVDVPPCSQRGQKDTLVRVVTVYNSAIGDTVDPGWNSPESARRTRFANDLFAHAQCEVVRFHGGRCADVYHAMNGRRGTRAAGPYFAGDYTHLNQEGHRLVARTLANRAMPPLFRRSDARDRPRKRTRGHGVAQRHPDESRRDRPGACGALGGEVGRGGARIGTSRTPAVDLGRISPSLTSQERFTWMTPPASSTSLPVDALNR